MAPYGEGVNWYLSKDSQNKGGTYVGISSARVS